MCALCLGLWEKSLICWEYLKNRDDKTILCPYFGCDALFKLSINKNHKTALIASWERGTYIGKVDGYLGNIPNFWT